jgi:hypothetical protein
LEAIDSTEPSDQRDRTDRSAFALRMGAA